MIFRDYLPSPMLQEYIDVFHLRHFIFKSNINLPFKPYPPRPEQCIAFYVRGKEITEYSNGSKIVRPRSVLSGQFTDRINRYVCDEFLMILVVFNPGALHRLTGIPFTQLVNTDIDAEAVFSSELRQLNSRLGGMPKIKSLHLWGTNMAPFVVQNNHQFRPGPPFPVNSPEYVADYNEIKAKGGRVGHTRTPGETEIGVFWVESASTGWNRFARKMLKNKKQDAWKTARLFALLHTAMADGITGCFEAKYHYFYWRPETAVREGDNDGNDNTKGDPTWLPGYTEVPNVDPAFNIYTPPLPDYPSAHATFGGSASEVLRLFFNSDKTDVDLTSTTLPNVTRHYSSLSQAARDNSLSRIYVGYHFRKAVLEGESQGMKIGNYVYKHHFREVQED